MAPKRKCPTAAHEPQHTNASSGEESRADPVPSTLKQRGREDEQVENEEGGGNESSGYSESESRSDDEGGVKHEPAKPLQLTKSSSDSDSDSDSCHESNPDARIRAVVAAIEEGAPVEKSARHRQLKIGPAERARKEADAEGEEEPSGASETEPHDEVAKHETLKPSQQKKPSPGSESSCESKSGDENRADMAVATSKEVAPVMKRPKKRAWKGSDANDGAFPAALPTVEGSARFQRLWSEKDEIKLLQGMIKFRKKKELEPSTNVRMFKDFLDKKSVRFDFSANESQFQNKMRKMKNKFVKGCEAGCNWKKPHDQKLSELSYVLWGGVKKCKTPEHEIPAPQSKSPEELENSDWTSKSSLLQLTSMGLDEEVLRIGGAMIDSSQMEKLKERWRQLRLSELQVANDRSALMNDQAKLFMDGYLRAKRHV